MVRFEIEKHCKKMPLWALSVLATFPYDRNKSYPYGELYYYMDVVFHYLDDFRYMRRNSMQRLGNTHSLICKEQSITIETPNGNPVMTIRLVRED